jgi:hypothetical protein
VERFEIETVAETRTDFASFAVELPLAGSQAFRLTEFRPSWAIAAFALQSATTRPLQGKFAAKSLGQDRRHGASSSAAVSD